MKNLLFAFIFLLNISSCFSIDKNLRTFKSMFKIFNANSFDGKYTSTNISYGFKMVERTNGHKSFFLDSNQLAFDSDYSSENGYKYLEFGAVEILNLGIEIKKYQHNKTNIFFTTKLFSMELMKMETPKPFINLIDLNFEIININRGVNYDYYIKWFNIYFGQGFNFYHDKLNYFIPVLYGGFGLNSLKLDKKSAGKLINYSDKNYYGNELELGIKLPFEYQQFEMKGVSKYRIIFSDDGQLEIIENQLKIAYNWQHVENISRVDSVDIYSLTSDDNIIRTRPEGIRTETTYRKILSISLSCNYDFMKVNSIIQPMPSINLNFEFDPIYIYKRIKL